MIINFLKAKNQNISRVIRGEKYVQRSKEMGGNKFHMRKYIIGKEEKNGNL